MARPRLEPTRLTKVITCRLSAEAHERWRAKVRASGLGAGAFLRRAVVENETRIVVSRAQRGRGLQQVDVARLVGQLAKLGNNLNQLARSVNRAHLEGSVRDETFEDVLRELRKLDERLVQFLQRSESAPDPEGG